MLARQADQAEAEQRQRRRLGDRRDRAADFALRERGRVEVDVGPAPQQIVQLRGECRAVSLGRVPHAGDCAAHTVANGVTTLSFGAVSLNGMPKKPHTTPPLALSGAPGASA